jgi:hypothetical protein
LPRQALRPGALTSDDRCLGGGERVNRLAVLN